MTFLGVDSGRVALFGDWHCNTYFARQALGSVLEPEPRVDACLQLGDFGVWPGRDGKRFLDALEAKLAAADVQLGFVDGNHENFELLEGLPVDPETGLRPLRPHVHHVPRGTRWTWGGETWLGLGGAVSLDRKSRVLGRSFFWQEEITYADVLRATESGPVDVVVAHDAPLSVEVPNLPPRSWWDRDELARADRHREVMQSVVDAVQPKRFYHGHFHSRYELEHAGCTYVGLDCDGVKTLPNLKIVEV